MPELDERSDARRTLIARLALVTSVALYAAVAVWVLVAGPDDVVAHFNGAGEATRTDTAESIVLVLSLTVAGITALFAVIPVLVRRAPIQVVNVPNRELWDTDELRPILARRLGADMLLIGAASIALITGMLVMSAAAGLGAEVPGWAFPTMTGAFLVVTAAIIVPMFAGSRYTPPAELLPA